jgi:hypothetical protein
MAASDGRDQPRRIQFHHRMVEMERDFCYDEKGTWTMDLAK